ncbi:hypothetical protein GCM10011396_26180 [Undibacterium terreum]|uniref:Uncharacterized protein n=1 Tax=Undibacterium terreum TaxID=1224302 RepID=A0A916XKD1_9BURK|nr:hypothetical protein GCM10011396_26180 [Undibacterium terreum]
MNAREVVGGFLHYNLAVDGNLEDFSRKVYGAGGKAAGLVVADCDAAIGAIVSNIIQVLW